MWPDIATIPRYRQQALVSLHSRMCLPFDLSVSAEENCGPVSVYVRAHMLMGGKAEALAACRFSTTELHLPCTSYQSPQTQILLWSSLIVWIMRRPPAPFCGWGEISWAKFCWWQALSVLRFRCLPMVALYHCVIEH